MSTRKKTNSPRSLSPANNLRRTISSPVRKLSPISLDIEEIIPKTSSRPSSPTRSRSSPKKKKSYDDIKKDTFENILSNYKYDLVALLADEKGDIEYIIALDPIGNIVYVDITDEDEHNIESSNFKIIEYEDKKQTEIKDSLINSYKDLVKNEVFGVVVHIDNELVFIKQKNDGEQEIKYKQLKTFDTKKKTVYPIITFADAIADFYDEDEQREITSLDSVEQTKNIRNMITLKQIQEVEYCFDDITESLNELLDSVKKLAKDYKKSHDEGIKSRKEYEKDCFTMYELYCDPREGLSEENLQEFNICKLNCNIRNKFLTKLNSDILNLKSSVVDIEKVNKLMKDTLHQINEDKKILDEEYVGEEVDF